MSSKNTVQTEVFDGHGIRWKREGGYFKYHAAERHIGVAWTKAGGRGGLPEPLAALAPQQKFDIW